ncbi:MAG: CDP-alcohol phosphatidyltransferase family protein [Gammaproteobacteria bacterium]
MSSRSWDARLAYILVRPLKDTRVSPNALTSLRLVAGLGAAWAFASRSPNLGAWLFALSNLLDHTDGELARITGKGSRFGHYYDLACDAVVTVLLFFSIGIGLSHGELGMWALPMGIAAGSAVAVIFHLRNSIEKRLGRTATQQPSIAGFEAEDVLYLVPLVTLFDGLTLFLIAATVFAPLGAILVLQQYRRQLRGLGAENRL